MNNVPKSSHLNVNDSLASLQTESLPEADYQKVIDLVTQLNIADPLTILEFGTAAQEKLALFSQRIIDHIRKKDSGALNRILNELIQKLELVNPDDLQPPKKKYFKVSFFFKKSSTFNEVSSKYQKLGAQIDRISAHLNYQIKTLQEDNELLELLYQQNNEYLAELNNYISAGEMILNRLCATKVDKLEMTEHSKSEWFNQQEIKDLEEYVQLLEKRLHDLMVSRLLSLQNRPQLRLLINTNTALMESIQSAILTSIPVWRNQIAGSLTMLRQKKAIETKNQMLIVDKTAEKNGQVLTSLNQTQTTIIQSSLETLRLEQDHITKRQQTEQNFINMGLELKKLLPPGEPKL
ncbi:toxic anion resistance protein [Bacillus sp. Marseille-P3661]|uniref:toxic anion resistance protein n=1 Tax=Bacillus sp. Marseille-P3661 TaxID=1936234 RepID=UPI000C81C348|nr:toxic anion resistance protein [Bacillus sp. Marseille-P3661]